MKEGKKEKERTNERKKERLYQTGRKRIDTRINVVASYKFDLGWSSILCSRIRSYLSKEIIEPRGQNNQADFLSTLMHCHQRYEKENEWVEYRIGQSIFLAT
jgi:glucan phosphorylase